MLWKAVTMDNDWEIPIRLLAEDEVRSFPPTDAPVEPSLSDDDLNVQLELEKVHGHPAYETPIPDYEPIDTSPDDGD